MYCTGIQCAQKKTIILATCLVKQGLLGNQGRMIDDVICKVRYTGS